MPPRKKKSTAVQAPTIVQKRIRKRNHKTRLKVDESDHDDEEEYVVLEVLTTMHSQKLGAKFIKSGGRAFRNLRCAILERLFHCSNDDVCAGDLGAN